MPEYDGPWPCRLPPAAASKSLHIPRKYPWADFGGSFFTTYTHSQGVEGPDPLQFGNCSRTTRETTDGVLKVSRSTFPTDAQGRRMGRHEETLQRLPDETELVRTSSFDHVVLRSGDSLIAEVQRVQDFVEPKGSSEEVEVYCRDEHGMLVRIVAIPDVRRPEEIVVRSTMSYDYDELGRPRSYTSDEPGAPGDELVELRWNGQDALVGEHIAASDGAGPEVWAEYVWDESDPPQLVSAVKMRLSNPSDEGGTSIRHYAWTFRHDEHGRHASATRIDTEGRTFPGSRDVDPDTAEVTRYEHEYQWDGTLMSTKVLVTSPDGSKETHLGPPRGSENPTAKRDAQGRVTSYEYRSGESVVEVRIGYDCQPG